MCWSWCGLSVQFMRWDASLRVHMQSLICCSVQLNELWQRWGQAHLTLWQSTVTVTCFCYHSNGTWCWAVVECYKFPSSSAAGCDDKLGSMPSCVKVPSLSSFITLTSINCSYLTCVCPQIFFSKIFFFSKITINTQNGQKYQKFFVDPFKY